MVVLIGIGLFIIFMIFIIKHNIQADVKNPLIKDSQSFRRRYHAWLCGDKQHIHVGPYYGMSQSMCRRCGKVFYPEEGKPEWEEPWGEYK